MIHVGVLLFEGTGIPFEEEATWRKALDQLKALGLSLSSKLMPPLQVLGRTQWQSTLSTESVRNGIMIEWSCWKACITGTQNRTTILTTHF
jgi:hypothetical protein